MDIWRLDFTVRNGSGRWLDHLIARFQIESEWPDCTNWDVPAAYQLPQGIEWAGSIGNIQESGRNVVSPGQTLTETRYLIVLRGDPEPRFSNWSMDFDFAAAPPPAGAGSPGAAPTGSAELDALFWQSIMNSTNPAEFEAYRAQFPNGVFRALAEARLAELRAGGNNVAGAAESRAPADNLPDVPGRRRADAAGSPASASRTADTRPPTRHQSIDFGDDTGEYARDGECDDPRFEGAGMSLPAGLGSQIGRDAADCRQHYRANRISLSGVDLNSGRIDFGDDPRGDSVWWVQDSDCDDPRFQGVGMARHPIGRARGHDATDCRRLFDSGRIRLFGINAGGVR